VENAISFQASWSPVFYTSTNSNLKVSKKFKKISGCSQLYKLRSYKVSTQNTLLCRLRKKTNCINFGRRKSDIVNAPKSGFFTLAEEKIQCILNYKFAQ
jgi:hypothetical protein